MNAWTRSGRIGASALNTAGPQYHPVCVRWFTEAGYRQLRIVPSGTVTCSGRKQPAFEGISGVRIDLSA